jgi:hypothetical protein
MASRRHQNNVGQEIEGKSRAGARDQHVVQLPAAEVGTGVRERQINPTEGMSIHKAYNDLTDVMFVDLRPIEEGSKVDVIDVGDQIGFSGQIQIRVDLEREIFYGLTIQNYTGFRKKLLWRYRMLSIQAALQFLITTIMVGLKIDRQSRHVHALPCL